MTATTSTASASRHYTEMDERKHSNDGWKRAEEESPPIMMQVVNNNSNDDDSNVWIDPKQERNLIKRLDKRLLGFAMLGNMVKALDNSNLGNLIL